MISVDNKSAIINNLVRNKLEIIFPDNDEEMITEINIVSESMHLKQSICDDNILRFGGCIASEFKIDLMNTDERCFTNALVGKWISVKITQYFLGNDDVLPNTALYPSNTVYPGKTINFKEFYIFSGFIDSVQTDKNDKNKKSIIAYDAMSILYDQDATNTLFELWANNSEGYSIGDLINICLTQNGKINVAMSDIYDLNETLVLSDTETIALRDFKVHNTNWLSNQNKISYGEILKNICEMVGLFGFIFADSGKGIFKCFPLQTSIEKYNFYEYLFTEDYISSGYTGVKFSVSGDDRIGKTYTMDLDAALESSVTKIYDMTDNIIVWQEFSVWTQGWQHDLQVMFNGRTGYRFARNRGGGAFASFTPCQVTLDGRLWVQVGDPISITVNTTNVDGSYVYDENGNIVTEIINTYILSRTLTGIQALTDKIETKGER